MVIFFLICGQHWGLVSGFFLFRSGFIKSGCATLLARIFFFYPPSVLLTPAFLFQGQEVQGGAGKVQEDRCRRLKNLAKICFAAFEHARASGFNQRKKPCQIPGVWNEQLQTPI
jgi:hypothetical protein